MSLERRDQLAEQIMEAQPVLREFVRPARGCLMMGSWDLHAYSFERAFEVLWDHARLQHSSLLERPLLSLWRQSVELAIKAAIIETAGDLDRKLGHDLKALFEELLLVRAAAGHDDNNDHMRSVRDMIAVVQSFDPFADRFRYPSKKGGEPHDGIAVDLDALFQAHWIITTWCGGASIDAEQARGSF